MSSSNDDANRQDGQYDAVRPEDRKYYWKDIEPKWQKQWKEWEIYHFDFSSEKPVFSIDTPPPYASGTLHMGRATGYTLIDFVGRYRRMRGYNVFYPMCVDVNGTPIEVRVEKKYNITKKSINRHEFIKLCSEFANDNIARMMHEFEILGESLDPSVFFRTDAEYYRRLTQISFLRMLANGLVYKGEAPVNWCTRCITALADAEVEYKNRLTKLNYIKFKIEKTGEDLIIATTRPELLCTCQFVAVNPKDDSKFGLAGRRVLTPIYNRPVEIFEDEKVDPAFGTGAVMVCTVGDKDDLEWVHRYSIPLEKGIDEEGRMTAVAGPYAGLPVAEARKKIIEDLKSAGLLVKQEDIEQNVGSCWRCHSPIEFMQVKQWFLKTRQFRDDMLRYADEIKWHPEFMKVRLVDWINSLQWDWVLSRQRYFATPIPVWECTECEHVIPASEDICYVDPTKSDPPVDKCPVCGGKIKGCEDVFDTWMDSSISPLFNTFWLRDEEKFRKLYPMTLRPQAHDIIRTWAYYTILRCTLLTGKKPWTDIMIHGFIMAPDGRPMHTSLGNVIDPLPILDEFGADSFRYYAATCSLGEDHAFIRKEVVHGSRFVTKFWNIQMFINRYLQGNLQLVSGPQGMKKPDIIKPIDAWILAKYNEVVSIVAEKMDNYLFDQALKKLEWFIWHELADHYIEIVKYRFRDVPDESALFTLAVIGLGTTKMLAPIMPHITEELYQRYYKDMDMPRSKSIHISKWPEPVQIAKDCENTGEQVKEIISAIRVWKSSIGIPLNQEISRAVIITNPDKPITERLIDYIDDIKNTVRAKTIEITDESDVEETIMTVKPVYSRIGPRFKERAREIIMLVLNMNPADVASMLTRDGRLFVTQSDGTVAEILAGDFEFDKIYVSKGKEVTCMTAGDLLIMVDK